MSHLEEVLKVANSMGAWITAAPMASLLLLFRCCSTIGESTMRRSGESHPRSAFAGLYAQGMVTSMGRGGYFHMVGLMSVIGAHRWPGCQLAVHRSRTDKRLHAATLRPQTHGRQVRRRGYNLQVMAVSWWTAAINGVAGLLLVGLFAHKLEDVREKVRGELHQWLGILSTAAMIGVFGYLNSRNASPWAVRSSRRLLAACNGHPASNREKTFESGAAWA